ncbi:hypothetical protein HDU87_001146 [Geranomyces variabilis]|uniref:Autophagy-related protein 27 n=1 Tax=Geranomyces variabilis TaxID=109894 RepID=A0AAD5XLG6_9FUNG|nr:hypothetical protein HDU87_001146 [Geranomyces variabilis]
MVAKHWRLWLIASLAIATHAAPTDPYDCKNIPGHGRTFDLSGPDFPVEITEEKAVSTKVLTVWGNACAPLTTARLPEEAKEECPTGTWFCELEKYKSKQNGTELLTNVRQFAKAAPEVRLREAEVDLLFVNGERSVNVSFRCAEGLPVASWAQSTDPNVVTIIYKTKSACAAGTPDPNPSPAPPANGSDESMSGWGVFWMLLFVASLAYCVIGSAYNYSVFRVRSFPDILPHWPIWAVLLAQGWDLIATLWERVTSRGRNYVHL